VDIGILVKNFNFNHFFFPKKTLKSVEILSPEASLSSSHKTKTTSFRRCVLAEAGVHRDFLLKTGLKSDFGPVEPDLSIVSYFRAESARASRIVLALCVFRWLSARWRSACGVMSGRQAGAALVVAVVVWRQSQLLGRSGRRSVSRVCVVGVVSVAAAAVAAAAAAAAVATWDTPICCLFHVHWLFFGTPALFISVGKIRWI
jgi:hypothetical protein